MTAGVQLEKKSGRESQGAWHQDEPIGGKPPVVKLTLTLTVDLLTYTVSKTAGKKYEEQNSTVKPEVRSEV
jgi:hypothetical protein